MKNRTPTHSRAARPAEPRRMTMRLYPNGSAICYDAPPPPSAGAIDLPVLVLPADPASLAAYREAVARAIDEVLCPEGCDPEERAQINQAADAAMAALGLGRKTK